MLEIRLLFSQNRTQNLILPTQEGPKGYSWGTEVIPIDCLFVKVVLLLLDVYAK